MDISLFLLLKDGIQLLCVRQGTQCADRQNLRLATGKQAGTMCTGQYAYLRCQRTDFFHATAIYTLALGQPVTDNLLAQLVNDFGDLAGTLCCNLFAQHCVDFLTDNLHPCITNGLVIGIESDLNLFTCKCFDLVEQVMVYIMMLILELRLADFCLDGINKCAHLLDFLMGEQQAFQHLILWNFLCTCFDHNNLFGSTANGNVHQALFTLLNRRVEDEFAVNQTDVNTGNGIIKRDIRNSNCDGCTIQCSYLRGVIIIIAHNGADNGNIIAQILREQRTHRAVNLAGSNGSLLTCLALATHKGTRDTAYCVQLFFKINRKREEIHTFTRLRGSGCSNQNNRITIANHCGTICQLCNLTGFYRQLTASKRGFKYTFFIK